MEDEQEPLDPFTLSCQSVLAHDMDHLITHIVQVADSLIEGPKSHTKGARDSAEQLKSIVNAGRVLHEMLRRHYEFQSDHYFRDCDVVDDLLNPSIELASRLVSHQKNSFRIDLPRSLAALPPVIVLKYRVQVALTQLISVNFRNIYKSHDSTVSVTGTANEDNVKVTICVDPTHLFVEEGEDLFSVNRPGLPYLQAARRAIEMSNGRITHEVRKMSQYDRRVEWHLTLPTTRKDNDTLR